MRMRSSFRQRFSMMSLPARHQWTNPLAKACFFTLIVPVVLGIAQRVHAQAVAGPPVPAAVPALAPRQVEPADLGLDKTWTTRLEKAVWAWQIQQTQNFYRDLLPVLEQVTPDQLKQLDQLFQQRGAQVSAWELLMQARMQLLLDNQTSALRKPQPVELGYTLQYLDFWWQQYLKPIKKELQNPINLNILEQELDLQLQRRQQLLAMLRPAEQVANHRFDLIKQIKPADLKTLPAMAQPFVLQPGDNYLNELLPLRDQVVEQIVLIHLNRTTQLLPLLTAETAAYRDRFLAVQRLGLGFATIQQFLPEFKKRKNRTPNTPSPHQVEEQLARQRQQFLRFSGPLRIKVYLFEQAKEWWLRGRFGQGNLYGGMVKVIPTRARRPEELLLPMSVSLPDPLPAVVDPVAALTNAGPMLKGLWDFRDPMRPPLRPLPYRHLVLWQLGEVNPYLAPAAEGALLAQLNPDLSQVFLEKQAWQSIPPFLRWHSKLTPIVGFLEYQMALYYFETLQRVCAPSEWAALETEIQADPRFILHTHLMRQYDRLTIGSSLKPVPRLATHPEATGPYERRGLAWVMAHARVELGAMLAYEQTLLQADEEQVWIQSEGDPTTGTEQESRSFQVTASLAGQSVYQPLREGQAAPLPRREPRSRPKVTPFAWWPPTGIEREAFGELLLDSLRYHMYSLLDSTPAVVQRLQTRQQILAEHWLRGGLQNVAQQTLAAAMLADLIEAYELVLRLRLTSTILQGYQDIYAASLLPPQQQELQLWQTWLQMTKSRLTSAFALLENQPRWQQYRQRQIFGPLSP